MIEEPLEFLQPTPAYRELCILIELERNPENSQKKIGLKVGLAPSMVNAYIKNIVERGFVECRGENHRRIKYFLTSSGKKLKAELLVRFINETALIHKVWESEFKERFIDASDDGTENREDTTKVRKQEIISYTD